MFRRQYLGNGLSDLLETFTVLDPHAWSKSEKVSSKSDKPFPRYCLRNMAVKMTKNKDFFAGPFNNPRPLFPNKIK